MGAPPVLTAQQRADALAKAAASRKRRAEVKSKIKSGDYTIDTVLELAQNDDAVRKCECENYWKHSLALEKCEHRALWRD
jgi:hypothetical protein